LISHNDLTTAGQFLTLFLPFLVSTLFISVQEYAFLIPNTDVELKKLLKDLLKKDLLKMIKIIFGKENKEHRRYTQYWIEL